MECTAVFATEYASIEGAVCLKGVAAPVNTKSPLAVKYFAAKCPP